MAGEASGTQTIVLLEAESTDVLRTVEIPLANVDAFVSMIKRHGAYDTDYGHLTYSHSVYDVAVGRLELYVDKTETATELA